MAGKGVANDLGLVTNSAHKTLIITLETSWRKRTRIGQLWKPFEKAPGDALVRIRTVVMSACVQKAHNGRMRRGREHGDLPACATELTATIAWPNG